MNRHERFAMPALVPSDRTILDLLRRHERMTVGDFERELAVTATAVRQRLNRLLGKGYIERYKDDAASGRGRPSHWYRLTRDGQRKTGTNFSDLATALWEELRSIPDVSVRRGLIQRISRRMADQYRDQVQVGDLQERLRRLAGVLEERQVPFEVRESSEQGGLPVLTALACPYPELAEQDRAICAMERMMFSELLGERVTLDACRLDGGSCCNFQLQPARAESLLDQGSI
jgi:predicted ArsR family transcriptional regulator